MRYLNRYQLVIWLFTFLLACTGAAQDKSLRAADSSIEKIDAILFRQYEQDQFQGGIVISHHGEVIFEKYLGIADRTWEVPVKKDVKFDIASVNKSMIAALVVKAKEEEKLQMDDKLVDLLSDFSYEGSFHPEITLHHLLSHTSGLPDYGGVPEAMQKRKFLLLKRKRFTNAAYVNFISKIEPVGEPGKRFYYSNFAYHLLCIILEQTYQMPFSEILNEKLTRPLGLSNTVSSSLNERIILKLAKAYNYQKDSGEWLENPFIDQSLGRRIFSTAADLNRWALVMDNPGYLSSASLENIQQNHLQGISNQMTYGYGWVIFNSEAISKMGDLGIEKPYIIHGGSTDGYKAMLININKGEYVISFLSNVGDRTDEMNLAKQIVNHLIP